MNVTCKNNFQFSLPGLSTSALKSTADRAARQKGMQNQVDFFEKQKAGLKNMECNGVEEIARKLELFHSYEDEIAAAKQAYNNEQIHHVMDEAKEIGEKIAEAVDKSEPKTEEERKKEMVEEALGIEEEKGALSDMLEETEEIAEEVTGEIAEDIVEENSKLMLSKEYLPIDVRV